MASWLHGVALRIAARARVAASAVEARSSEDRPFDSCPAIHEEILRLPRHHREPIVLCYLEGLSVEQASLRIGCPRGKVLSRLARARERLRVRLTRRGLAPMGSEPSRSLPLPGALLVETVGRSLLFAGRRATEAGLASAAPSALAKGWLRAMALTRWTIAGTAAMSCVLAMGGWYSFARSDVPPEASRPVEEAAKAGRRVWVIHGRPRCAPCIRLGRWIDEHRSVLEKDLVVVNVMGGIDLHAEEVVNELPEVVGDGIPWHAITEADGTILVTSRGPLGNIGFPSSVEDLRHFRRMLGRTSRRITAGEIDELIRSLSPAR